MISIIKFSFYIVFLIKYSQCRDVWDADLPEILDVSLEKGKPIQLQKKYEQLQIRHLNGTLYTDSLSQLKDVKELRLFYNQITEIETGALCSPPALEILLLNFYGNTAPPVLTKNMFKNCNNLKELFLTFDYDDPSTFNHDIFEDLSTLKKLAIVNQKIIHLKKNYLKVNKESLTELVLQNCHIKNIDSDAFEGLENLRGLQITFNQNLNRIPDNLFTGLSKLNSLILTSNNITNLTWKEFEGLSSLKTLDLTRNSISFFDAEKIAKNMPNLEALSIELNPPSCKQKEAFVNKLRKLLNHSIEVSYKFDPGFYDSCEEED